MQWATVAWGWNRVGGLAGGAHWEILEGVTGQRALACPKSGSSKCVQAAAWQRYHHQTALAPCFSLLNAFLLLGRPADYDNYIDIIVDASSPQAARALKVVRRGSAGAAGCTALYWLAQAHAPVVRPSLSR